MHALCCRCYLADIIATVPKLQVRECITTTRSGRQIPNPVVLAHLIRHHGERSAPSPLDGLEIERDGKEFEITVTGDALTFVNKNNRRVHHPGDPGSFERISPKKCGLVTRLSVEQFCGTVREALGGEKVQFGPASARRFVEHLMGNRKPNTEAKHRLRAILAIDTRNVAAI